MLVEVSCILSRTISSPGLSVVDVEDFEHIFVDADIAGATATDVDIVCVVLFFEFYTIDVWDAIREGEVVGVINFRDGDAAIVDGDAFVSGHIRDGTSVCADEEVGILRSCVLTTSGEDETDTGD